MPETVVLACWNIQGSTPGHDINVKKENVVAIVLSDLAQHAEQIGNSEWIVMLSLLEPPNAGAMDNEIRNKVYETIGGKYEVMSDRLDAYHDKPSGVAAEEYHFWSVRPKDSKINYKKAFNYIVPEDHKNSLTKAALSTLPLTGLHGSHIVIPPLHHPSAFDLSIGVQAFRRLAQHVIPLIPKVSDLHEHRSVIESCLVTHPGDFTNLQAHALNPWYNLATHACSLVQQMKPDVDPSTIHVSASSDDYKQLLPHLFISPARIRRVVGLTIESAGLSLIFSAVHAPGPNRAELGLDSPELPEPTPIVHELLRHAVALNPCAIFGDFNVYELINAPDGYKSVIPDDRTTTLKTSTMKPLQQLIPNTKNYSHETKLDRLFVINTPPSGWILAETGVAYTPMIGIAKNGCKNTEAGIDHPCIYATYTHS